MKVKRVSLKEESSNSPGKKTNKLLKKLERRNNFSVSNSHSSFTQSQDESSTFSKNNQETTFILSQGKIIQRKDDDILSFSNCSKHQFIYSFSDSDLNGYSSVGNEQSLSSINRGFTTKNNKTKENHSLKSTSSYKKYNLIKNRNRKTKNASPLHKYLPPFLKNNEKYKMNLIKYLRKGILQNLKTDTCKYANYEKSKLSTKSKSEFSLLEQKKRKVHSTRKIYSNEHFFFNYKLINGETVDTIPVYFKFYKDNDIGFFTEWQQPLKEAEMDDDVDTDNEQLIHSQKKVMRELIEGVFEYKKNHKSCRNYLKYQSDINLIKVNRIYF